MLKNSLKYLRKIIVPFSVSIICVYALYLRIMALHQHTLWIDELYELKQMEGTFLEFLQALPRMGFCSYLFGDAYIFFPFFKIFSYNKWGLAIPCIISTILSLYILYLICKRYFRTIWAYLITFTVVCFNATLIQHATEIRSYAFLPTLALATFYLFQRLSDLDFKLSVSKKIGAAAFFILVIWFHAYGILMFATSFVFTVLARYKEGGFKIYLKKAVYFAVLTLCFAMPFWLYSVLGPHFSIKHYPFDYITNPCRNIIGFLKGIFGNLVGNKKLYFLLLGCIIPAILTYKVKYKQLLFLCCCIIVPVSFILLSDVIGEYWFLQRQFIWVMPFFAIFLGWAWESFFLIAKSKLFHKKGSSI